MFDRALLDPNLGDKYIAHKFLPRQENGLSQAFTLFYPENESNQVCTHAERQTYGIKAGFDKQHG